VALLTALGVLGFRHGVLPPLASRGVPVADAADRARRFGQTAMVIYVMAALIRVYTEAAAMAGPDAALAPATLKALLTTTTWGIGWMVGAIGALVLAVGWWLSKRSVTIGTPLALTGGFAIALSPALSGHAAAAENFVLAVTLDVLHVLAAGLWLGGLLLVLIAGIPAMLRLNSGNTHAAVSALVNSFHPIALFCAPLAVVAGAGSAWIRLGGLPAITSTPYGRILLLKTGLFIVVVAMALYNANRARRRLGTAAATTRMRWSGAAELVVAALVIAATTVLVTTPMPALQP
jgi:putative copper export protein